MLCNDFEAPLSEHYPLLKEIKQKLYDAGAIYASLTGSGSCLYGFFPKGKLPHPKLTNNLNQYEEIQVQ